MPQPNGDERRRREEKSECWRFFCFISLLRVAKISKMNKMSSALHAHVGRAHYVEILLFRTVQESRKSLQQDEDAA